MQTIHRSRVRNFLSATVTLIASLGLPTPVSADINWYFLNSDGKLIHHYILEVEGYVTGFNDAGQVIGEYFPTGNSRHAFIIGPNSADLTDLGSLGGRYSSANAINAAGQVVGYSDTPDGYAHAYITGPNGTSMTDLGIMPRAVSSIANGINTAGQVMGNSDLDNGGHRPFMSGPNGLGISELIPPGGDFYSTANGISDSGQVILNTHTHAFLTGPNSAGMTELGIPGSSSSSANAINAAGQVVGFSRMVDGQFHAYITGPNGVGITDLGVSGLSALGSAEYISDAGRVIGYSLVDGYYHAFITGPNGVGLTDLNSLAVNLPEGYVISAAYGINSHEQILVSLSTTVVPEADTYAMLLAGLMLISLIVRRRAT